MVDFVKTAEGITAVLKERSKDLTEDERIRYIYNEAMDDAINFMAELGKRNPTLLVTCMALEREMREWLPLREGTTK